MSLVDSNGIEPETTLWSRIKGKHVVLPLLEKAADVVEEKLRSRLTSSPADALYDFNGFKRLFGGKGAAFAGVALSETDLKILLKFLARDRVAIVVDKNVRHPPMCQDYHSDSFFPRS